MWGTDLTTTFTGEGPAAVFVAVDHCSAKCLGVHAHSRATRFERWNRSLRACGATLAASPRASPMVFRCGMTTDHNICRTTSTRRSASSASKVHPPSSALPEGNGCAERFIRTLKENLLWVRHFETIEELRQALLAFREVYNTTWLIERHGFISPAALRQKQLQPVARAA
jgi:putative transposase